MLPAGATHSHEFRHLGIFKQGSQVNNLRALARMSDVRSPQFSRQEGDPVGCPLRNRQIPRIVLAIKK